jgi:hypothetical protein
MVCDIGVLAKLPADLAYLAAPALKYGCHQFDEEIFNFLDHATDDEMSELAAIAERVRLHGHYSIVNQWLDEFPITNFREAACLYFLFGVMDCADLDFASDTD